MIFHIIISLLSLQVESSVVRIEPRVPPPPVNFTEWDGLLRIVFARKNKTLGAQFKNKSCLDMLEKNYRVHCSMNNKTIPADFDMKNMMTELLSENNLDQKRARNMDTDDFLALLHLFNSNGIHFT